MCVCVSGPSIHPNTHQPCFTGPLRSAVIYHYVKSVLDDLNLKTGRKNDLSPSVMMIRDCIIRLELELGSGVRVRVRGQS